jgi:hypothetical protein
MPQVTTPQTNLRKLAAELRQKADEHDQAKLVKSALWVRSIVGLTLMKRKLGRNG